MPPEDKSRIENLKQSLYSRTAPEIRTRRKLRFSDHESKVQTAWEKKPEEPITFEPEPLYTKDNSMSILTKFLIASVLFCLIAVGAGAYLFFNGSNLISANNIDISISGPVSIPGGEPVSFNIGVINKNNIDLKLVDMAVDFPAGATDPNNQSKELREYRKVLGDIPTGGVAHDTVDAVIFGEENQQKTITVTLTYSIKGSQSVFTKSKTYDVLINSSPITVSVDSFKEISSGQEFDMTVKIKSNSQQVLQSLLLKATYPFGYTLLSSDIKPLSDNSTWKIGDLPAGAERTLTIHGKLQGEDTDARTFQFTVGAQGSGSGSSIGTQYMAIRQDITIQKPFMTLSMTVNGDNSTSDVNGSFDRTYSVEVNWFNNLSVPLSNVSITMHLSGSAYDRGSVQPQDGYFNSATDDIIWNPQTTPGLAYLDAGKSGRASFVITPRNLSSASKVLVNPSITLSATAAATRAQESNVPEQVSIATSRNIKMSSNLSLSGRVVRSTGPFTNTGPIPPKVDQPTTYTIVWSVDNTSNEVSNAQVTASLPAYVTWLNAVSPDSETIVYDKNSGTIAWNIGNLGANISNSSRRREVSFQVSIQPSMSQVGQAPTLVNQATLTAQDTFTNTQVQSAQDPLTIRFSTDPQYREGQGIVTQ